MRIGQKNKLTYRWARKGSRPRAIHDQRTQSTYLFGAVCPEHGTGAALALPFCNTEAMQLHLDEIATRVTADAHAIIILDQAGWHGAKGLKISEQHLAPATATTCTRAQQPGKHLAVHAAELAVKSCFQNLRRHRRSLLPMTGDDALTDNRYACRERCPCCGVDGPDTSPTAGSKLRIGNLLEGYAATIILVRPAHSFQSVRVLRNPAIALLPPRG